MTDALVRFLRDRLDDDVRAAQAAGVRAPAWPVGGTLFLDGVEHNVVGNEEAFCHPHNVDHIARHDPARVLREVEAKRVLLDDYERFVAERRRMMGGWDSYPEVSPVLTSFAAIYADHPDYRDEWRP